MTTASDQFSQPRSLTHGELAGVVRAFRGARTWSQEQLAEIAGISSRTIQRAARTHTFLGCGGPVCGGIPRL